MAKVFLCYRRDDAGAYAGRVKDWLERDLGTGTLFMDVDNIDLGRNFVKVLNEEVAKCEVLLAFIGKHWLDARDENGNRRLDNSTDFVQIEILAALQRDIPVIPILVDGANVPSAAQLPKELEELSFRQGIDVRLSSFVSDVDRLSQALKRQLKRGAVQTETPRQPETQAEPTKPQEPEIKIRSFSVWMPPFLKVSVLFGAVVVAISAGLAARRYEQPLKEAIYWFGHVRGHVLTVAHERALKPKDVFQECDDCPEMIVVPAGNFKMGSPATEKDRSDDESPQHMVTIAKPFAVARFDLTFDEWDACAAHGDCGPGSDQGWGRGRRPAVNVSWGDAQRYVEWLSRLTGRSYRLLTEAEWEYAARAGSPTAYYWGDEIGKGNANCNGCGSQWDGKQTAPVGSFAANALGIYDIAGNVWEWVEDCYQDNYDGAPTDGSAWTGDCSSFRVLRGGSWYGDPQVLRSAARDRDSTDHRSIDLGFRVGRTLTP